MDTDIYGLNVVRIKKGDTNYSGKLIQILNNGIMWEKTLDANGGATFLLPSIPAPLRGVYTLKVFTRSYNPDGSEKITIHYSSSFDLGFGDTVDVYLDDDYKTANKKYAQSMRDAAISSAVSSATTTAASDATSKANTALINAKTYADTKKTEAIQAAVSEAKSAFVVEAVSSSTITYGSDHRSGGESINAYKTGYTPIGIVGYHNTENFTLEAYMTSDTLVYYWKLSNTDISGSTFMKFDVLYKKN